MMSSSREGSSSTETSNTSTTRNPNPEVNSIIPMAVLITSHPEVVAILTYPRLPTKCKEHVVIKVAREFGVMPRCDVRTPESGKTVMDAREGGMTFFRDALKVELRWPLHPFH